MRGSRFRPAGDKAWPRQSSGSLRHLERTHPRARISEVGSSAHHRKACHNRIPSSTAAPSSRPGKVPHSTHKKVALSHLAFTSRPWDRVLPRAYVGGALHQKVGPIAGPEADAVVTPLCRQNLVSAEAVSVLTVRVSVAVVFFFISSSRGRERDTSCLGT